jgi:tetratricopeptide (TPR) repeat protein
MVTKTCALIAAALFFGLHTMNSWAEAQWPRRVPNGFTWGELAILPEYCRDTQGTLWDTKGNGGPLAPNTPRWVAAMGEDFFHTHHYCYGLRNIHRAKSAGESTVEGKHLLRNALNEFRYMTRNVNPSMPLLPEIYLRQGETFLKLGSIDEANVSFENSRRLRPSYWPAYTRWADVLVGLKLQDRARALLLEGLQHAPGEPELVKRLAALGVSPSAAPVRLAPTTSAAEPSVASPGEAPASSPGR